MGCKPCEARKARKYDVVASSGRIIYSTDNEATAKTVAAKSPGATVREASNS